MTRIKSILIFILILTSINLIAQDTIGMKEVYIENELVYKVSDRQRFTGLAQSRRKNGHLVYEEEYKDGVILSSNLYFNGKNKIVSNRTIYNRYKPFEMLKKFSYGLKKNWTEITSYNDNGLKILVEQYEDEKLIYRCEYSGKKKHGKEFCYSDDGEELTNQYVNGKKKK